MAYPPPPLCNLTPEQQQAELNCRRALWKQAISRIENRFKTLLKAKPGTGMFGQDEFNALLSDLLPDIEQVGLREKTELIRFTADKFPNVGMQVFNGTISDQAVREFVQTYNPRGLVAVGHRASTRISDNSKTLIYTSNPAAGMMAALLFTAER